MDQIARDAAADAKHRADLFGQKLDDHITGCTALGVENGHKLDEVKSWVKWLIVTWVGTQGAAILTLLQFLR